MAFEVYTPKKRKRREEPKPVVSLSKSSIVLNKVARKTLPADRYELAFDRERRIIRLKPSPDGVFVKKTKINARGFFKQFDIDYIIRENSRPITGPKNRHCSSSCRISPLRLDFFLFGQVLCLSEPFSEGVGSRAGQGRARRVGRDEEIPGLPVDAGNREISE